MSTSIRAAIRVGMQATLLALAPLAAACGARADARPAVIDREELTRREARLKRALANPDAGADHDGMLARWLLPDQLKEISGLALTRDGRLLTHSVKRGRVFEIDYRRGMIVKEFSLAKGDDALKGDLRGITAADDRLFIMSADGTLYEFREGADRAKVDYLVHDTGLRSACNFEGVAFARAINSLLLACHEVHDRAFTDALVIFRWKLDAEGPGRISRLTVPFAKLGAASGFTSVHPSDITVEPFQGNYVLIAAREKALIEVTPEGEVVRAGPLPGKHPRAEGVTVTTDSLLIISDEAGHRTPDEAVHRPAVVTLYRWQREGTS